MPEQDGQTNLCVGEVGEESRGSAVRLDVLLNGAVASSGVERIIQGRLDVDPRHALDLQETTANVSTLSGRKADRVKSRTLTSGTVNRSSTSRGMSRSLKFLADWSSFSLTARPSSPSAFFCASMRAFSAFSMLFASAADGLPTMVIVGASTRYLRMRVGSGQKQRVGLDEREGERAHFRRKEVHVSLDQLARVSYW